MAANPENFIITKESTLHIKLSLKGAPTPIDSDQKIANESERQIRLNQYKADLEAILVQYPDPAARIEQDNDSVRFITNGFSCMLRFPSPITTVNASIGASAAASAGFNSEPSSNNTKTETTVRNA